MPNYKKFLQKDDLSLKDFMPDTSDGYIATAGLSLKTQDKKIDEIEIIGKLMEVKDPEIPVNIYELGLIYKIEIDDKNKVEVEMTLTSPNCPVAESLPKMVKDNILSVEGVSDVDLKLVWSPPWTKDKMSEAAKLELNL